jgi:UDP-N-acetylmuramoyl-L-alanyl-D-glutamate--2,6-diaminopimelate ligase
VPSLTKLIHDAGFADARIIGDGTVEISGIANDSRQVKKGFLFIAITGTKSDGAHYIEQAIANGAVAVLSASDQALSVAHALLPNPRAATARIAAAFYPKTPRFLFAITGTDGKTSTADFLRQLASLMGDKAASIGTLGLRSPEKNLNDAFPAHNTSPDPILLHRTLQQLAEHGVTHVAMEASSHGLDQSRLDGMIFTAAAYTNLTRDHLDYHGTAENYAAAKMKLFDTILPPAATAILNRDDGQYDALRAICKKRGIAVRSFGAHTEADYRILSVTPHARGLDAVLVLDSKRHEVSLPLYGAFQLSNMLAAMGLLQAAGASPDAMVLLLPKLKGVPGRLEKIAEKNEAPIFVDYAHTPAALENILKTLRPHTQQKLHVVFGAGGDRDAGKRPEMGKAAQEFADVVMVTDDNPRSEDPALIRAAIMAAAPKAVEVAGRDVAIARAVKNLSRGDVLVVAGKGHETSQIVGSKVIHFSDAEHIREAIHQ